MFTPANSDVLPYFIRMENNDGRAGPLRGAESALWVYGIRERDGPAQAFIDACI